MVILEGVKVSKNEKGRIVISSGKTLVRCYVGDNADVKFTPTKVCIGDNVDIFKNDRDLILCAKDTSDL